MKPNYICDGIYRVAAKIGTADLFEGIWPIPNGVMLNTYVVKGSEKIALMDYVCDWETAPDDVGKQLLELGLNPSDIDYLVINHMEPDHTGALKEFIEKNPNVEIICTKKSVPMLKTFFGVIDNVRTIKNGEEISLGDKTLVFYETPNVHWPETMMTYAKEDEVLFSCDGFGSFGVYEGAFDDELTEQDKAILFSETERYYSNIVSTFSMFVKKAIEKVKPLSIKVVAPSHGIIYRNDPAGIIEHYAKLAEYGLGNPEKEITLIWSSMYGNTGKMVKVVKDEVEKAGIKLHVYQVPQTHESNVLEGAWRSKGIIIGMPTYEYKMFPPMYHVLDVLERSHVKDRLLVRFGSFGWSKGAEKQLLPYLDTMKFDYIGQTEYQGAPTEEDEENLREQIREMISKL